MTDFLMLVRYAVIGYMTYRYGLGSPLIDPTVDLVIAGAAALWGFWDRVLSPWLSAKFAEIKKEQETK